MDKYLEYTLKTWGPPSCRVTATEADLERLQSRVPPRLIEYWRATGFSAFENGLLSVTNPLEWQDTVDEWIADTELKTLDNFIPVLRGCMGEFLLFGLKHGYSISVLPTHGAYIGTRNAPKEDLDIAIASLFLEGPEAFDPKEATFTFHDALTHLGPLHPNEIYGFVPLLPMGGTRDLHHLQKVDAFAHLSILRQATGELRGIMEYRDLVR